MDDTLQFNIPNKDTSPPENGEYSSASQTENSAFLSPDIVSMTDEPYDQEGYFNALSQKSPQSTPPQTLPQMVQAGRQELDEMVRTDDWNEGRGSRTEKINHQENIEFIVDVDNNLEKWRDNESNTSSSGEDL